MKIFCSTAMLASVIELRSISLRAGRTIRNSIFIVLLMLNSDPGHGASIFDTPLPDGTRKITIDGQIDRNDE